MKPGSYDTSQEVKLVLWNQARMIQAHIQAHMIQYYKSEGKVSVMELGPYDTSKSGGNVSGWNQTHIIQVIMYS